MSDFVVYAKITVNYCPLAFKSMINFILKYFVAPAWDVAHEGFEHIYRGVCNI